MPFSPQEVLICFPLISFRNHFQFRTSTLLSLSNCRDVCTVHVIRCNHHALPFSILKQWLMDPLSSTFSSHPMASNILPVCTHAYHSNNCGFHDLRSSKSAALWPFKPPHQSWHAHCYVWAPCHLLPSTSHKQYCPLTDNTYQKHNFLTFHMLLSYCYSYFACLSLLCFMQCDGTSSQNYFSLKFFLLYYIMKNHCQVVRFPSFLSIILIPSLQTWLSILSPWHYILQQHICFTPRSTSPLSLFYQRVTTIILQKQKQKWEIKYNEMK